MEDLLVDGRCHFLRFKAGRLEVQDIRASQRGAQCGDDHCSQGLRVLRKDLRGLSFSGFLKTLNFRREKGTRSFVNETEKSSCEDESVLMRGNGQPCEWDGCV